MNLNHLIIPITIAVILILILVLIACGYVKAPPDQAYIISGLKHDAKILIGRSGIRIPFFERMDRLYLGQMTVDIKTEQSVPTNDFINVNVDAVAKVRITPSQEGIRLAAKNFLNKKPEDITMDLQDSLQGNMREIIEQREQSAKYAVENELMEKVAANIECDIPDALIDEQCARFLEEFKQRLQSQGIPYDQYCKMTNMDEAKFLEEGKEPATRQVRMDLAVNAIIKEEKLEATDEEVEKQYNDLAEKYSMDVGELKKYLDAMSVRTQIIRDKAISVVVDSAKIEKKKAPKKEAEGAAAEGEEKPAKKTAAKKSAKKEEEKAE